MAMYAADVVHHLLSDHDAHPRTFQSLRRFLLELDTSMDREAALLTFQWALADDLGYRPVLDRDAQTGEPLGDDAETVAFSPVAGGLVADTGGEDRWRVRHSTAEALQTVSQDGDLQTHRSADMQRANRLMCAYFRSVLDRQLPTMDFLIGSNTTLP